MKVVIGILSSSVGSMNTDFGIRFSEACVEKGHSLSLWLSGNSVVLAKKSQKQFKDYSFLSDRLKGLTERAEVAVCEACAQARGIMKEDVVDGIRIVSMDWFTAKVSQADRALMIGSE
jgi:sulfur relay (sulfurtransferase) complex TusBCD TusD component (DsrE family)